MSRVLDNVRADSRLSCGHPDRQTRSCAYHRRGADFAQTLGVIQRFFEPFARSSWRSRWDVRGAAEALAGAVALGKSLANVVNRRFFSSFANNTRRNGPRRSCLTYKRTQPFCKFFAASVAIGGYC
jgi:hypothetical protein